METDLQSNIASILDNIDLTKKEQFDMVRDLLADSGEVSKGYLYYKARMIVDPEFKQRFYSHIRKYTENRMKNDPEFRKRMNKHVIEYQKRRYQNDEVYREKQKEISRGRYHANEEYRERKKEQALARYYKNKLEASNKAIAV
ncbi:hypothetical protein EOM57_05900 [Candidatus Saccharibacteria bacterium]|nr:hypothetical protein [Candidatus Saccharibacteria bacterium]